ncbi:ribonuclease III [Chloroflexi bacterium TSY]|nr:ribonuclease III [Chloroflexi bacterium TSY]
MEPEDIQEFEKIIGQTFQDRKLLQQAFVHRSYINEAEGELEISDNERLEFLGDSVLGFVVSELLYQRYPGYQEGNLTSVRSALVRQETLSALATKLQMGDFLWLGRGEESSNGRTRPVTLCATFEAVVGALYLDRGMEGVSNFLLPLMNEELSRIQRNNLAKDAKSRLQEWAQSNLGATPRYKKIADEGPDHAKIFTMRVSISSTEYGVGRGRSKQSAAQNAAAMALYRLDLDAPEYEADEELEALWPLPKLDLDIPQMESDNVSQSV